MEVGEHGAPGGGASLWEGDRMFDRITFDPHVMGGRACIRGLRITVSHIVSQIAHGAAVDEILENHPDLGREDVGEALKYAAWLTQERVYRA